MTNLLQRRDQRDPSGQRPSGANVQARAAGRDHGESVRHAGSYDAQSALLAPGAGSYAAQASALQPVQMEKNKGQGGDKDAAAKGLPKGLTEENIADAVHLWAPDQNLAKDALTALQAKVGAARTGVYDRDTAIKVYQAQSKSERKKWPGVATRQFFMKRGLIFFEETKIVAMSDGLAAIKAAHPNGVNVGIHTDYTKRDGDNIEITKRAGDWGPAFKGVALIGGQLVMGQTTPIKRLEDVVEVVRSIHASLLAEHRKSKPKTAEGNPDTSVPAFTQVRNLALFAHGFSEGISLDKGNSRRQRLRSHDVKGQEANLQTFVKSISGALAGDVAVQLFACSAGRSQDETSYKGWVDHDENERLGEGSFADELNKQLEGAGKTSTVYAHATAGHTHENHASRVFGKGAEHVKDKDGDKEGGAHMLQILYPAAFLDGEVARLFPDASAEVKTEARSTLRAMAWRHYKDAISTEHRRRRRSKDKRKKKVYDSPIGRMMFMDPGAAAKTLQTEFKGLVDKCMPTLEAREKRRLAKGHKRSKKTPGALKKLFDAKISARTPKKKKKEAG